MRRPQFPFSISRFLPALTRRLPTAFVGLLLVTEFLDEFHFGIREAAWPAIRTDLNMDYVLLGLVLGLPGITSSVLEIGIGVAGDTRLRRPLIVGGGIVVGIATLLFAASVNGWMLLAVTIVIYPATGAFVSLSQASLMDTAPDRHEHNMALWTSIGSAGVVAGTLVVVGATELGVSWRWLFVVVGILTLLSALSLVRAGTDDTWPDRDFALRPLLDGLAGVWRSVRSLTVARWLVLLEVGDFMVDVFLGFIAVYFVDVVGVDPTQAALAVTVWTVVGLAGDFALIPLLERVNGMTYLRASALATGVVFALFLITREYWVALVLVGALGFLNAGWYAILQARLYSALPGRSGSVMSITSAASVLVGVAPLAIGALAAAIGLQSAMWLLMAAPVVLFVGLPRR